MSKSIFWNFFFGKTDCHAFGVLSPNLSPFRPAISEEIANQVRTDTDGQDLRCTAGRIFHSPTFKFKLRLNLDKNCKKLYIKHISFFLYLFAPCAITEPVADPGYGTRSSPLLLLRRRALADPGHGSWVLLLRCGADPQMWQRSRAGIPAPPPPMTRRSRAWILGPPPQMWRRSRAWIPCPPPLLMPRRSWILILFPSLTQQLSIRICLSVSLHSLLSPHNSNDPPLEFVCLFLYILYFPHRMATTLSGICLSASLHSLISSHNDKNNPSYPLLKYQN
jgi:hypothetical protein